MNPFLVKVGRGLVLKVDSFLDRGPRKRLLFIHVPKCGGTSIVRAISGLYNPWQILRGKIIVGEDVRPSRKAAKIWNESAFVQKNRRLTYYLSDLNTRFIHGGFGISKLNYDNFHDEWDYLTVLRDPVKRWISQYFYSRYSETAIGKTQISLDEYIESPKGKMHGYLMVRLFSEQDSPGEFTIEEKIKMAKENLLKIDLIGSIDKIAPFINEFNKRYKCNLKLGTANKSPAKKSNKKITEDQMHRITKLCEPDIELYESVKKYNNFFA